MKTIFISLLLVISAQSSALEVEFVGPCSEVPLYSATISSTDVNDVGSLSIMVLEKANIPFKGTSAGINQIFHTPIGLDAMEVISDQEMMSYGWCYEIDGEIPEVYPNEIGLEGIQKISWFYGYAHYLDGQWIAQCQKGHLRHSPYLCK